MREEGPNPKAMAEAIQAMLAQHLNMNAELEILEQRVFRERLWKLDLQFIFIRWFADYPDPHNEYYDTLYSKLAGGRRQAWSNAQFDTLLEQGRAELDWDKRLEIYRQAEEVLQQDVGYVPVVWGLFLACSNPGCRGYPQQSRKGHGGRQYLPLVQGAHVYCRACMRRHDTRADQRLAPRLPSRRMIRRHNVRRATLGASGR